MITSKSNELIKTLIKLKTKKFSKAESRCVVESIKLIRELYSNELIECIFVTQEKLELVRSFTNTRIELISDSIAKFVSDSVTSDGVIAIAKIPNNKEVKYDKCIILDRLQDPSNMGAIIRSAKAFGYNTILTIDCAYPYSYKCVRSSMGHVFGVNLIEVDFNKIRSIKENNNILFLTADMEGVVISKMSKPSQNFAIVIGNEGSGVSKDLLGLSDRIISIPMQDCVESLNASVSAGIIMYLLK